MKVAIHADPAAHEISGGVGVYVRHLVDELLASSDGNSYKLIVSRTAEPPARWSTEDLIRPALPVAQLYTAWNFTGRPKIRDGIDIVHATGLAIPPAGGRLVATIHDLTVETMPEMVPVLWRHIYLKGLQIALDKAQVLCAVSEATKKELVDRHSVDPDRVVVTPEAPNLTPESVRSDQIFERLGLTDPYILCVGTVEPRKNQIRLVKAFAESQGELKDWSLVIAGSPGWGQDQVTDTVESLQLGHRIFLTGKISGLELASLYSRAWVFAFPSVYEGFGIPLLEAFGFGIPSLASTTPALAELAGSAALLIDPSDTSGMAEALVALATDEELRERLANQGRERAGRYSWKATADSTRHAYEKAMQA
jgi:glycosyltransferase involved in cell wall biosynthesis